MEVSDGSTQSVPSLGRVVALMCEVKRVDHGNLANALDIAPSTFERFVEGGAITLSGFQQQVLYKVLGIPVEVSRMLLYSSERADLNKAVANWQGAFVEVLLDGLKTIVQRHKKANGHIDPKPVVAFDTKSPEGRLQIKRDGMLVTKVRGLATSKGSALKRKAG